jgi:hypothetical protein
MNRQKIFNHVANHLISQSAKAQDDDGACRYRARVNNQTLKCAIGCLIDDSVYEQYACGSFNKLEEKPVDYKIVREALTKSGIDLEDRDADFLRELQEIHDHSPVALWGTRLTEFARQHELKLPCSL